MLENHYDEKTEQEFKAFLESIGDSIVVWYLMTVW